MTEDVGKKVQVKPEQTPNQNEQRADIILHALSASHFPNKQRQTSEQSCDTDQQSETFVAKDAVTISRDFKNSAELGHGRMLSRAGIVLQVLRLPIVVMSSEVETSLTISDERRCNGQTTFRDSPTSVGMTKCRHAIRLPYNCERQAALVFELNNPTLEWLCRFEHQ